KTVLLQSSPQSRTVGVPRPYSFDEFDSPTAMEAFNQGPIVLGVLLEGSFTSAYRNRIKPFSPQQHLDQSPEDTKMIVISEGDIMNYQYANKKPLVGDIDPWTKQQYGNRN